jgi:ribose transport system substrate-binding protein
MSWKRFTTAAAVGALALSMAACGSSDDSASGSGGGDTKDVKTIKIGFAQQTLTAPYYVAMQKKAEAMAKEQGWNLVFQSANVDPVTQINQVQTMVSQGVDVIVVNAVSPGTEKAQMTAIAKQKPLLFIDTAIPDVGFTTYQSDNVTIGEGSGELMAKRFKSGDTIKLAILNGGPRDEIVGPDRRKGFLQGLEKGGVKYEIVGEADAGYAQDKAVSATEDLLAAHPDTQAIFAYNDSMGLGAMQTLKAKGNKNVLVSAVDGQKEALALINEGCESQYVSTGLNSPDLAAEGAFTAAVQVATGEKKESDFQKVTYTKAVGIGCDNIKDYYDPNSVF